MRSSWLLFVLAACCLAAPAIATAQTPVRGGAAPPDGAKAEQVFEEPAAPQPAAPQPAAPDSAPADAAYDETVTYRATGPAPEPPPAAEPEAARPRAIDPRAMAETVTNSVLNSSAGAWDPTLGSLTTGDAEIDRIILESSARHGVDPKLVFAVMQQESGFKRKAISHKGASGYMQLMPATARRFGVTDIFDPRQNIDAGTKYLRFLLDLFDNNVELALAGYNAGENRVIRDGYRVPNIRETRNYVRVISANYYGRTKRRFAVTYGPSRLDAKEREEIVLAAYATTDDRGDGTLSNIY